jgi:hypothetical protein
MEAVRAVQRGEMSVHRAGSYFGVPHSTLEYKVKERHLLRQKKIKDQQEQREKDAAEAAAAAAASGNPAATATATSSATVSNHSNGKKSSSSKTSSGSGGNSGSGGGKGRISDGKSPVVKQEEESTSTTPSPWRPPYINNVPRYDTGNAAAAAAGLGFFNSSFALSTPASELLRKLQHKVQTKAGDFPPDSNGFSFHPQQPNGVSPLGERFLFMN